MSEITAITPQKKDKLRCNIEVDGRFYCGLKLETVMQNRLKVGAVVTPELLSQLQLQSEKQTALDKALVHISASMKTEREIRLFLQRKGYLQDVSDYVVEKMKGYGYLDDAAYAAQYAEQAGKKKGARLIAAELKRRGIDDQTAINAVSELKDSAESAKRVLDKYLKNKELTRENLRKGYAYLISKGFDYDTARSALSTMGENEEE